jgi:hypothetical protein
MLETLKQVGGDFLGGVWSLLVHLGGGAKIFGVGVWNSLQESVAHIAGADPVGMGILYGILGCGAVYVALRTKIIQNTSGKVKSLGGKLLSLINKVPLLSSGTRAVGRMLKKLFDKIKGLWNRGEDKIEGWFK